MTPGPLDMIEAVRAHHRAYEQGDWNAALAVLAGDLEYEMVDSAPAVGPLPRPRGHRGRDGGLDPRFLGSLEAALRHTEPPLP